MDGEALEAERHTLITLWETLVPGQTSTVVDGERRRMRTGSQFLLDRQKRWLQKMENKAFELIKEVLLLCCPRRLIWPGEVLKFHRTHCGAERARQSAYLFRGSIGHPVPEIISELCMEINGGLVRAARVLILRSAQVQVTCDVYEVLLQQTNN